jgi:stage V sporulation protein B
MARCYLKQYRGSALAACARSEDVPEGVGRTLAVFVRIGVVITLGASVMSLISLIDTKLIQMTLPKVAGIGPAVADELYGSYSSMQTLYNLPASFVTPMTIAVVPAISAAATRRARGEVSAIAESGLRISAVIAMPMGAGLAVLSEPIVKVLFRDPNPVGPKILTILAVASVFVCIALVTNAILQADGAEKLPIISMVVGGALKILCNLLLVRRPDFHILGAAVGTVVCYAAMSLLNCVFIFRRMETKPRYDRVFLRPLLSAAVMGAGAWAAYGLAARLLHIGPESGKLPMLVALCAAMAVGVVIYVVMIVVTRSVTLEDMRLIPKGEKLARLLHIR